MKSFFIKLSKLIFRDKIQIEFARKLIHMSSIILPLFYLYIFTFYINYKRITIIVFAILVIISLIVELLRLENKTFRKTFHFMFGVMLRRHEINNFTGASYLLVSAIFCIAFFPPDIAFLAMAFLSIGDTFAALVGIRFGKRIFIKTSKSLEGTLACFVTTFIFGLVYLQLPIIHNPEYSHPAIALSGAISASVAELVNIPLDDNVKIPIISGIVMWITYYICGGLGL